MPFEINPYDDMEINEVIQQFLSKDPNSYDLDYMKLGESLTQRAKLDNGKCLKELAESLERKPATSQTVTIAQQFLLGLYHHCDLSPKHLDDAVKQFSLIQDKSIWAKLYLSRYYHQGYNKNPPNLVLALKLTQELAEKKMPQAFYTLCVQYIDGAGVEKDDETAYEYLKKASESGLMIAYFVIGSMNASVINKYVLPQERAYLLRRSVYLPKITNNVILPILEHLHKKHPSDLEIHYHYIIANEDAADLDKLFRTNPKKIAQLFFRDMKAMISITAKQQSYKVMNEMIERYPHAVSEEILGIQEQLLRHKSSLTVKSALQNIAEQKENAAFSQFITLSPRYLSATDNFTVGFHLYHFTKNHSAYSISKISSQYDDQDFEKNKNQIENELDEFVYPFLQTAAKSNQLEARRLLLSIACSRINSSRLFYLDYVQLDIWDSPSWKDFFATFRQVTRDNSPKLGLF